MKQEGDIEPMNYMLKVCTHGQARTSILSPIQENSEVCESGLAAT